MRHNVDSCLCGNEPIVIGFYIKGVANHKNYFVKCENCMLRTRNRKSPSKAIEEWNEFKGELFLKERGIR